MLQQQLLIILLTTFYVNAKLCENVNVRNEIRSFEKHLRGCTVVAGNLEIALIEKPNPEKFAKVSFPELTEIRGYLLMFRVYGLRTLAQLFPNLSIIRGLNLFKGYSLILFDLVDLKEIALPNLKYILKGSTRIERCPHLCYVKTVNWTLIGSSPKQNDFRVKEKNCGRCPENCKGLCWNKLYCQQSPPDNCHPECVGCTQPNSPDKCIECRNYKNNGICVSECPKGKVRHPMLVSCMTDDECSNNSLHGIWLSHEGECIQECPPQHIRIKKNKRYYCQFQPKICDGIEITSTNSSEHLNGCTHINGSLILQIDSKTEVDELYKNLNLIQEIDDYLKIRRSAALTSLDFFKKLKVIHGKKLYNQRHALVVFENDNLYTLWEQNQTIEIKNGTIFFHDNFNLCLLKIDNFAKQAKLNYTDFDVSPYSNGGNRTCNYITLNITISNINSTNVTFVWENVTATKNLSGPIGYLLSYTEDPDKEITIFDEHEECYENIWQSVFVVDNTTHQIIDLNQYTQYAYYIKLYTNSSKEDGQTKIAYFTTLSDDPSELVNFEANSTTSDSVTLDWELPVFPNGILGHYELIVYYEKDDEVFLNQRNYCKNPRNKLNNNVSETAIINTCCHKDQHIIFNEKFDFTCDRMNIIMNADSKPGVCKNYMYSIDDQEKNSEINTTIDFVSASSEEPHKITKRSIIFPTDSSTIKEISIDDPTLTTYTIEPLKHFSMFVFLLKVCHKDNRTKCSSPMMIFQRTLPKEDADDIPPGLSTQTEDNSTVTITWAEPKQPNSIILSYEIEHKKINDDNSSIACITKQDFIESNHEFQITNLTYGQYYMVRVRTISLAGPGKFTKYFKFIIGPEPSQPYNSSIGIIIGTTIVVISILIGIILYYRHYNSKNKTNLDQETLITNQNSDYYLGPTYIEDEWEINREDVEIYNKITQGSFITIYTGCIKSQNRACIVKSTTKTNLHEKISFLNETSIMKWSSGANHVLKLLGVVSKTRQPLILMELVADGDLKAYLRKLRYLSMNLTNNEMYRMAAEIADGMVYLSSKKFVHRDLSARNCMVCSDHTIKIGDYGISKDIYKEDYIKKESNDGKLIPVRWMAPESLTNDVFTTDSDIWSFGILLWEITTFANRPYEALRNEAVADFVTSRGILQRPPNCPDLLWEIMKSCWEWRPNNRPLFTNIVGKLEGHVGQHFSLVSFYHSTEGEKYRKNTSLRVFNAPALSTPFSRNSSVRWNVFDDNIDF